jgi:hypothetical protein
VVSGSGTYISVEVVIPTSFTSPGLATVNIRQRLSGTTSLLATTSITATNGMTLRTIVFGGNLWVFYTNTAAANQTVWSGTVAVATGNPGIGGYSMPAAGESRAYRWGTTTSSRRAG